MDITHDYMANNLKHDRYIFGQALAGPEFYEYSLVDSRWRDFVHCRMAASE